MNSLRRSNNQCECRCFAPKIDTFRISISGYTVTETAVEYHINPQYLKTLPYDCLLDLYIEQGVAAANAALPVYIKFGERKFAFIDAQSAPITGADIPLPVERIVHFNKCNGLFRFVDFTV